MSNKEHFDLIIVGAGINGAGIFRDAALNGMKVLLLDAHDLCTQTSARSSKLLHGGIRYLQTLDFALVSEALQEKNLWLKLAPQFARIQSFILPVYKESPVTVPELYLGLKLYDMLSFFHKPSPTIISKKNILDYMPQLKSVGLKGGGLYYDGIVDDRGLALFCIQDGLKTKNTQVETFADVQGIDYAKGTDHLISVNYKKNNNSHSVCAKDVVFCTGPFTDQLIPQLGLPWKKTLALSKGSHLWLRKDLLHLQHALVMQDKSGRVIFLIPYPDKILLGTTELALTKDDQLFNIEISAIEKEYLIQRFQEYFPQIILKNTDIVGSYCGVRPLVNLNAGNEGALGQISRHHHLFHPHPQITVLLGGKYTTFRTMGQDVMRYVCQRQHRSYNNLLTLNSLKS